MGQIMKTYDLSKVILVVGTFKVGGYGEDGGIEIEQAADIGEVTVGADGESVFSRNNNRLLYVNVTVLETSAAYKNLAAAMKIQEALPIIIPMPFLMQDLINGDSVQNAYCTFVQRPGMAKGRKVGTRTFRLALPGASSTALYGILNLI